MIEIEADIFDFLNDEKTDAICITTNGIVNSYGLAIMGAGTAGEAARRWQPIRRVLGHQLSIGKNIPYVIGHIDSDGNYLEPHKDFYEPNIFILSFPTKDHFKDKSKLSLIESSAKELVSIANTLGLKKVILPVPGCGLGGLDYKDVKTIIEPLFDNRFYICFKK